MGIPRIRLEGGVCFPGIMCHGEHKFSAMKEISLDMFSEKEYFHTF